MRNHLRKDTRALSPIFATLILIAITVGAGIMVYMFSSGYLATMLGGGSVGTDKIAIETIMISGTTVNVYAKSLSGAVNITEAIIKDANGATKQVITTITSGGALPTDGSLGTIVFSVSSGTLVSGNAYTVTLISKSGAQFVSPSFKA